MVTKKKKKQKSREGKRRINIIKNHLSTLEIKYVALSLIIIIVSTLVVNTRICSTGKPHCYNSYNSNNNNNNVKGVVHITIYWFVICFDILQN